MRLSHHSLQLPLTCTVSHRWMIVVGGRVASKSHSLMLGNRQSFSWSSEEYNCVLLWEKDTQVLPSASVSLSFLKGAWLGLVWLWGWMCLSASEGNDQSFVSSLWSLPAAINLAALHSSFVWVIISWRRITTLHFLYFTFFSPWMESSPFPHFHPFSLPFLVRWSGSWEHKLLGSGALPYLPAGYSRSLLAKGEVRERRRA